MYVSCVEIHNFLTFKNFNLSLHQGLNFLVGTNGTGKTSFLKVLSAVLSADRDKLLNYCIDPSNAFIGVEVKFSEDESDTLNKDFLYQLLGSHVYELGLEILDNFRDFDRGIIVTIRVIGHEIEFQYRFRESVCQCSSDPELFFEPEHCHNIFQGEQNRGKIHHKNCFYNFGSESILFWSNIPSDFENFLNGRKSVEERLNSIFYRSYISLIDEHVTDINKTLACVTKDVIPALTEMVYKGKESLPAGLACLNKDFQVRKRMYDLCNESSATFSNVAEKYKIITGKTFSIQVIHASDDFLLKDYVFLNVHGSSSSQCSCGEYDLLRFLLQLYDNVASVILLDEPVSKLSSQNKVNFRNKVLVEYFTSDVIAMKKQLLMVTHDKEFVYPNTFENLIHFRMTENGTQLTLFSSGTNDKKLICETPEILFCDRCILVEGYSDYVFVNSFMKESNYNRDANIIPMHGCGSKLYSVCQKLGIKYKIMFDYDKFSGISTSQRSNIQFSEKNVVSAEKFINSYCNNIVKDRCTLFLEGRVLNIEVKSILRKVMTKSVRTECGSAMLEALRDFVVNLYPTTRDPNYFNISPNEYTSRNNDLETLPELNIPLNDFVDGFRAYIADNTPSFPPITLEFNKIMEVIRNHIHIPVNDGENYLHDLYGIMREDKNIFVFDFRTRDLEGVGKLLFGNAFKKQEWMDISQSRISKPLMYLKAKFDGIEPDVELTESEYPAFYSAGTPLSTEELRERFSVLKDFFAFLLNSD